MDLPKGYKKTWNSGGGRPPLNEQLRKKSINVYLTMTEKEHLDLRRGALSISNYIKMKLGLSGMRRKYPPLT